MPLSTAQDVIAMFEARTLDVHQNMPTIIVRDSQGHTNVIAVFSPIVDVISHLDLVDIFSLLLPLPLPLPLLIAL